MKKLFISLLFGIFITGFVYGEPNWTFIGKASSFNIYIDNSRLDRIRHRAWTKAEISRVSNESNQSYYIQLMETNCLKKEIRTLYYGSYSIDNKLIYSSTTPSNWEKPKPETSGDKIVKLICEEEAISDTLRESSNNTNNFQDNVSSKEISFNSNIFNEDITHFFIFTENEDLEKRHQTFKKILADKLFESKNSKQFKKYLTKEDVYEILMVDFKFFDKNGTRYFYTEGNLPSKLNDVTYDFINIIGQKPSHINYIEVSCQSLNSPIDITKGECFKEIQKQFDITLEKKDLPIMNLH